MAHEALHENLTPGEPVSVKDIARLAGVSPTTVYYALRGGGTLSPHTRERIQQMADELGYRPNHLARSLRTRRTGMIGVITSSLESVNSNRAASAVRREARDCGYRMLVTPIEDDFQDEVTATEMMLELAVEGLVICARSEVIPERLEHYRRLAAERTPVVFLADVPIPGLEADSVVVDNLAAGYAAGRHFLRQGRSRLAYVGMPWHAESHPWASERLRGLQTAAAEAEAGPVQDLRCDTPPNAWRQLGRTAVDLHFASGNGDRPNAIMAANDETAYGVLEGLAALGLRVPEDVAVIGFDDLDGCRLTLPPLASFRTPEQALGAEVMRLLYRRLQDRHTPSAPQQVRCEPVFVARESCGPTG
ncbi:MAG TPA: LacI family DNA-binding transcriptional regulator [Armatimonadota bacterium]